MTRLIRLPNGQYQEVKEAQNGYLIPVSRPLWGKVQASKPDTKHAHARRMSHLNQAG